MNDENKVNIKNIIHNTLQIEADALKNIPITDAFVDAINAIFKITTTPNNGRICVSGIGKSGIICKKIAATLSSTGTPAYFVHPTEALHGDLGQIAKNDGVILVSNSGETDELLTMLSHLQKRNIITFAVSKSDSSTLAKNVNYHISTGKPKEACPLLLAPTSSTTATLAIGDAVAISLMSLRNFTPYDFSIFHPGGAIGRKLLHTAKHIMKTENLPFVKKNVNMTEVIDVISTHGLGLAIFVDDENCLQGIITDGDVRRTILKHQADFFKLNAYDVMTKSIKYCLETTELSEIEAMLDKTKVVSLLVLRELSQSQKEVVGVIQRYDLNSF